MSLSKIRYQITPKEIDDDDVEEELGQYLSETDVTNSTTYGAILPDAQKEITLPQIADHLVVEFIANQDVSFKIYDSTGVTEIIEFKDCRNLILKATLNNVYKVINNSGQDATIVWRLYA
jgi:hypothetical protein